MIPLKLLAAVAVTILFSATLVACESEPSDPTASGTNGATAEATIDGEVSPEIAVLAHRLVFAYLSDKTWGFFGATCEKWIEMDYEWDSSVSELQPDGRVRVAYGRQPDRLLGPDQLVFFVDIDSGDVEGDNKSDTGRSGIAEGCDQW